MTEKEIQKWELRRSRGRDHYVWRYGVLEYGLSLGLLAFIVRLFYGSSFEWYGLLFQTLIIFFFVGVGYGYCSWSTKERKYNEHLNKINE
jgi:hypothetical protein